MTADRPISEDDLQAYVDQALEPGRRAVVEAYLDQHPDVAQRVEGFARQRAMLREALLPIAQEPVPPELALAPLIEAARRPRFGAWRSIAATVLVLAIGGASGWFGHTLSQGANGGIAALAQEALDNFRVYGPDAVRPVEIRAADSAALITWVSRRLERPVVAPDLAGSGYRFMGGRLVATTHGPAGLFMYDDDRGARLVVLVRKMAVEQNAPMIERTSGPFSGFAWAQDGLGYSVAGSAPAGVLHPLADEVRKQLEKHA